LHHGERILLLLSGAGSYRTLTKRGQDGLATQGRDALATKKAIAKLRLAMVFSRSGQAIAKACGLDDATQRYETFGRTEYEYKKGPDDPVLAGSPGRFKTHFASQAGLSDRIF